MSKPEAPKVKETAIGGVVAALAVWAWNANQLTETGTYYLKEPYSGLMIALVSWAVGPLLRKYERWGQDQQTDLKTLAQVVNDLAQEVKTLKEKDNA